MTAMDRRKFLQRGGMFAAALMLPPWAFAARPRGLVGDGVADDTAALRRAIEDAGPELRLPAGRYRVTGSISIDRPIRIRGAGRRSTVIVHDGPAARDTVQVRASGVRLEGLRVDGTRATPKSGVYGLIVTAPGFVGTGLEVTGNGGTIVANPSRARWERCSSSIWIYRSTGCVVEECDVTSSPWDSTIALVSDGSSKTIVRDS